MASHLFFEDLPFGMDRLVAGMTNALKRGALVALILGAPAHAQDRRIVTIEDADFFGSDYRTVKDVDLEACKAACLSDGICQAFTFNTAAGWCFLKSDFGQLQSFRGAVAGRVVAVAAPREDQQADRKAELSFLERADLERAETYAARIRSGTLRADATSEVLRRAGAEALGKGDGPSAETHYAALAKLEPGNFEVWGQLALSQIIQNPSNWEERRRKQEDAVSAAVNSYLRTIGDAERAQGFEVLGRALADSQNWKPAIKAMRAAVALQDEPRLRRAYEQMVAEHGFRILDHTVSADASAPRICLSFSSTLQAGTDFSPYLSVSGQGTQSVEAEGSELCVDGVVHGERYRLNVRSGLPAADGETLLKAASLNIYVRDRAPSVHFIGRAYVLPAGGDPTIPIVSVNTGEVEAAIYRVGDRALAGAVREGKFLRQMSSYAAERMAEDIGEQVWSGVVETENRLNEDITTGIPLNDLGIEVKPGVYAMTARSRTDNQNQWGPLATQWFIVSDIGLATLTGTDGIVVNVRSLTSAEAKAGVGLRLLAVNNEILGQARSDAKGIARFEAGLARGRGGQAPSLIVAETEDGDYSFLDLRKPAFDLSDRGVEGRPAPGPLDVFAWTDRGVYKAGETIHAQALIRNAKAEAQQGLPLTFLLERPDGVEHSRYLVNDAGLGGHLQDFVLEASAQQGVWSWRVHVDPKGDALAQSTFLVEDYQPERVDFSLESENTSFDRSRAMPVSVSARFLYGSPASDQKLEGEIVVAPSRELADFPGYTFGLADDVSYPTRETLPGGLMTDAAGSLAFDVILPDMPVTTGIFKGELVGRLVEAGGRFVERRLAMPVALESAKIGIRPEFEGGVDEGGPATFNVIMVGADGTAISDEGLSWTLSRIERRYQWYRSDGTWNYEPITTTTRVANGDLDVSAGGPASISVPVDWGRYRLEVQSSGADATATDFEFSAGWYTANATSETPDYLEVGLDKASYRPGETALLRLTSQMDGTAVVNVVSGGVLSSETVELSGGEAELELPVSESWGAGAYVTASLYRPMDIEARRMPSRSVGLSWLQVEPGERELEVSVDVPDLIRPSSSLSVPVRVAGLKEGQEAYVTLAAVDLGILNLTGYEPTAPEDWYFGQRRLGVELRDLYGQLIDRMAGTRGRVRSGGDAMSMRTDAPPPDQEPVALFSGIVKLDAAGNAEIPFDVPEFNGTLRFMAVAWTEQGVGHSVNDLEVRSPVVLSASLPAFLSPGDRSRLRIDMGNVDGPAGAYQLTLTAEGPVGIGSGLAGTREIELAKGAKQDLVVPLVADAELGTGVIYATLSSPDGAEVVKRLALEVRDTRPDVVRQSSFALSGGANLSLDTAVFEGLRPGTVSVNVTAGGAARINVAGIMDALDRYPYGCTEQTTSRALPLLYLNQTARMAGLGADGAIRERVEGAIRRVLGNQSADGSFGLWNSYGSADMWLDAYVADFLTRAREEGYEVPERAFDLALSNLENRLAYASDFSEGGEGIAYGLYVLARNSRASMGDLRYYLDAKLNAFTTPLAKAQLAAGLALYGETRRAREGFEAAILALGSRGFTGYRQDYGSVLRDGAGVLSYVSAQDLDASSIDQVSSFVRTAQQGKSHYSTQDMAWLLMAARELNEQAKASRISINGIETPGRLIWNFDGHDLEREPVRVENRGEAPVELLVSVAGQPVVPEPASGFDYEIERQLFDLDGNAIDPQAVAVNTRLAVVVTVRRLSDVAGRLMIVDRIPAGLAIDNPRLLRSGEIGGLDWLQPSESPEHAQFHEDRFEAAVDESNRLGSEHSFVYLARAVSPGEYTHPPATVEDMYRPERRANTAIDRMTILGPVR